MSRKGKAPIMLPKGVEVQVKDDQIVVKGPKGTLQQKIMEGISLKKEENLLHIEVADSSKTFRPFHGLYRALVNNMVIGTSTGFEKKLEMVGVGYRAAVSGQKLDLLIGTSHPTQLEIPTGIHVKVEKNVNISVSGIDKQAIGEFAAKIRSKKPPEPFQGKGIRYEGEYVRKKAGKAAKTAKKIKIAKK